MVTREVASLKRSALRPPQTRPCISAERWNGELWVSGLQRSRQPSLYNLTPIDPI